MQHIQDKDLDQLFKATFADAEITPSANLWSAIEEKIRPEKKKRSLPLFWMAAASIAVVLTITLVFNKQEKIQLQGSDRVAVKEDPELTIDLPVTEPVTTAVAVVRTTNHTATKKIEAVQKEQAPVIKSTVIPQTVIAQVEVSKIEETETVIAQQPIEPTEQVVYAQVDPAPENSEVLNDNDQAERKGIRNVGDLVNFVVDKVDKREKKAIRFKTEDDESSLIGINIGFLKFNSKKKDR